MTFLILSSTLNVSFSGEFVGSIVMIGIFGMLFTVGIFFLSKFLIVKGDEEKRQGMMRFCMVFSNNGFLGLPLAKAVFGESPIVTYVIILNIITNILMFTLGVYLISGDKDAISLKKAFLNPVLLAFIAGIGLNLLNIKSYVLEVVTFSTHFSNVVTPLSMTILGIKMAGVKFSALFTSWRMYFVSGMKLIVFPALGVGILFALKLVLKIDDNMIVGFLIALAMPTAGLASTFSDQHDGDTENAVVFTLGTTILSILTIPILYGLLNLLL
jgi:predicted permease